MEQQFDFSVVEAIASGYGKNPQSIIAILQDIQEHYHYLPREIFPYLSKELDIPEARNT